MTAVSYYTGPLRGNVARYAALRDYHVVVTKLLEGARGLLSKAFPGCAFEAFTDNSPIPEVYAAVLAGLGVRGGNGLLITPEYGSYVVLGELVTDLLLAPSVPQSGGCGSCGRCREACPEPAAFSDKTLCVSGLTQKKGPLTQREEELIKKAGTVFGCDRCQDVCPHNRAPKKTWVAEFYEGIVPTVDADTNLTERAWAWRGRDVLRRNLDIVNNR